MWVKARWIVPITSPPIENGWIRVEDGEIVAIGGGWREQAFRSSQKTQLKACEDDRTRPSEHLNLGDSALFPGLINAHAHLEFGKGDHPRDSFARWVESVQKSQEKDSPESLETRWHQNIQRLIETGTTTVVNHCNTIPPLERVTNDSSRHPLNLPHILYICEIVGSSPIRAAESYREACQNRLTIISPESRVPSHEPENLCHDSYSTNDAVISPTSLYAVSPLVWEEFIKQRVESATIGLTDLVSIHIKESAEEDQLFQNGKGPLANLIKKRGGILWQYNPITWLKEKNLLREKTLLIHGNYLNDSDLEILQGTGVSVIHCPGSHKFFSHQRFPLESVQEHNINVALGTDSLASNDDLSMLNEMRLIKENYPELTTEAIVIMATLNGARAIGEKDNRGSLEIGKYADMIAVRMDKNRSPWDALLEAEEVEMAFVRGNVVYSNEVRNLKV